MTSPANSWLTTPTHLDWLDEHARSLLAFGSGFVSPQGGAGWLTDDGTLDAERGVFTWITCRMAHVYGLGALLGVPGDRPLAQAALDALRGRLHDDVHGGWFASVAADGTVDTTKSGYAHAFVVLAASTGVVAGLDGAREPPRRRSRRAGHAVLRRRDRSARGRVGRVVVDPRPLQGCQREHARRRGAARRGRRDR